MQADPARALPQTVNGRLGLGVMRRASKIDVNQPEIVDALREMGATVAVLSAVGKGFPDLCVGYAGVNALLEVKMPDGKLTPDQCVLHGSWRGKIRVVRSAKEAVETVLSWRE